MSKKLTRKEKKESREFVRQMAFGEFEEHDWVLAAAMGQSPLPMLRPPTPENFLDVDAAEDHSERWMYTLIKSGQKPSR